VSVSSMPAASASIDSIGSHMDAYQIDLNQTAHLGAE
jgi:hypothetical protein